jgi:hypothetical protein
VYALLTGLLSKATPAGLTAKVAAGAAAIVVAGGGVAAAAQALEPTAAETTTAADPVVTEPTESGQETATSDSTTPEAPEVIEADGGETVPVDGTDPTAETDLTSDAVDTPDVVTPEDTAPVPDAAPAPEAPVSTHPDNHGAKVSEVAHQSFESGREHGKAVSSAAHDKGGESEPETESPEAGTETPVDSSSTADTDQPAVDAAPGSGKHGRG